jgi:hypothetical protein
MTFDAISNTVSAYVIRALTTISPHHDTEIHRALSGLIKYQDGEGAFGSSFKTVRGVGGSGQKRPNATSRHTASALQCFRWGERTPPRWKETIRWLVKQQKSNGGWSDDINNPDPDCDSTGAVLWALNDRLVNGRDVEAFERDELRASILKGLGWLDSAYDANEGLWVYRHRDLAITDTCYVLQSILPIMHAAWIPSANINFIRRAVNDLNQRWEQDGGLGKDAGRQLANTVWGLLVNLDAQLPQDCPSNNVPIEETKRLIRRLFDRGEWMRGTGLIDLAVLLTICGKLEKLQLPSERATELRHIRRLAPQIGRYPGSLIRSLQIEIRAKFGSSYIYMLSKGRYRTLGHSAISMVADSIRHDVWIQFLIGIALSLAGIALAFL